MPRPRARHASLLVLVVGATLLAARVASRPDAIALCHTRGAGLYALPDPACTPGALDPAVSQATIARTICRAGWTASVRPPAAIIAPQKRASMRAYGLAGPASAFEYDHLVPLELGGAPDDPRNLWPERDYARPSGFYRNPKDRLERTLNRLVCAGAMTLARARAPIAHDWPAAYDRYG